MEVGFIALEVLRANNLREISCVKFSKCTTIFIHVVLQSGVSESCMVIIFLVCDEILKCVTTHTVLTEFVVENLLTSTCIYKTLTDDYWYSLRKEKPTLQNVSY